MKKQENKVASLISKGTEEIIKKRFSDQQKEFKAYENKWGVEHPEKRRADTEKKVSDYKKDVIQDSNEEIVALINWKSAVNNLLKEDEAELHYFDEGVKKFGSLEMFKAMNANGNEASNAYAQLHGYDSILSYFKATKKQTTSITGVIDEVTQKAREKAEIKAELKATIVEALKEINK